MSGTNLIELLVALFGLIPPIREAFTGTALRESLTNEPKKLLKLASKFRSNDQKYAKRSGKRNCIAGCAGEILTVYTS